jgi:hypothetical protein
MRDATPSIKNQRNETDGRAREAVSWLASQLRWERTLDRLRSNEETHAAQAA